MTTTETTRVGTDDELAGRAVVTLRMLAADAVEKANSGHPGLPMGAASMAYVLWARHLRHDPSDPAWSDRDRFVLSPGHGSMLLYGLLHLFGYDMTLDDIKAFRQWGSRTPGHPEVGHTPGVETTTGPLGQGLGNAVGMALAERMAAARWNRPGGEVVSHRTFVIASDGDLMEGVASEAASLAGHLGLGRLIVLYDDNAVTIDGGTSLAFTEDVTARFDSYGWRTERIADGDDLEAIDAALTRAIDLDDRPTLIAVKTTIGFGAPTKAGTSGVHGSPLGADELAATKAAAGWPADEPFLVPADVREHFTEAAEAGRRHRCDWDQRREAWAAEHPHLDAEGSRVDEGGLPAGWEQAIAESGRRAVAEATRVSSGATLQALAAVVPELVGGSADLASSTNTAIEGGAVAAGDYSGRTIHFGVREHAMGAILNGMTLHGGFRTFGSTFLVFSDYMRPAIRMAALSGLGVTYLFTHDSIGLGEDGPTHQPVEHVGSLRMIPGLAVVRPADGYETAEAWGLALSRSGGTGQGPTALVLTRQTVPILARDPSTPTDWLAAQGARVVAGGGSAPLLTIVATGSEVGVAVAAAEVLAGEGRSVRVVSMPWRERFSALPREARHALVPPGPVLVVEAASPQGWEGVAGDAGGIVGLDRFGASAPGATVMAELGFHPTNVAAAARRLIDKEQ